jgi:F-type H+-transporting ATPase subunit delta
VRVQRGTYARALFEAAKEKDRLRVVHEELDDFAARCAKCRSFAAFSATRSSSPVRRPPCSTDLLGGSDDLLRNFLRLTAEKGRIGQIEEIAREFDRLMAREERRLDVELTTARELSDTEASDLLQQIEQASGRKIEATRRVDPNLIAGFVLQAGSMRVDASVRGRLEGYA